MPLHAPPPSLVVHDILGPTVQGHGPSSGRRCAMISLAGCNLACSWCDSPQAWNPAPGDPGPLARYSLVRNIVATALESRPRLVVVTGGEPLHQQRQPGWPALLDALRGVEVEIETNGTYPPSPETVASAARFLVSPKLAHSGDPAWMRVPGAALANWSDLALTGRAQFSFVVRDVSDVSTVLSLCTLHGVPPELVWVVPEGTRTQGVLDTGRRVAGAAVEMGFNLSARLHVELWDRASRELPVPLSVGDDESTAW